MNSSTPVDPAQPTQPTEAQSAGPDRPDAPWGPTAPDPEPGAAPGRSGRGRTLAVVGGVLAIVAAAAGGTYAVQQLGGGGAQPESALPSTTVGFVKVDVDPSASQKVDAIRFLRKFPDAKVSEDADLRKVIFDAVKKDGGLAGVDYAKDVEPWLGKRVGFGLVPGADGGKPAVVVALAVEDRAAATASLPKLTSSLKSGACQVVEDYALCTKKKEQIAALVSAVAKGSLADSPTFKRDLADLGETGPVTGWVDAAGAVDLARDVAKSLGTQAGAVGDLGDLGANPAAQGRTAFTLRFDGPNLELAGHTNGANAAAKLTGTGNAGAIATLPRDTLAAVSVAGAGRAVKDGWPALEKYLSQASGAAQGGDLVPQLEQALGISLPDDLVKALGSQLTLAFGGLGTDTDEVKVALVTDGDRAVLRKLTDSLGQGMGAGGLAFKEADKRTVVGLSDTWADAVAAGGDLGTTAGFTAAVHDLDTAQVAAYVDIAGLVKASGSDLPAKAAKNLAPLGSVGLTASQAKAGSANFVVRLTTR